MQIIRPKQVELRSAWKREDQDFTPWLAQNLDFLEDVGLGDLEILDTEVKVPGVRRRLDIMATTADDRRVAIENQYRSVDHDHLTRGLAYAVGLQADALVVIAEGHGDEFIAVADYLNECAESNGTSGISVFLVSLRLEKIADYFVPRFEVVSRPNEWRAAIKQESGGQPYSDAAEQRSAERRRFWTEFLDVANQSSSSTWSSLSPGQGGSITTQALSGVNVTWNVRLGAESCNPMLWIDAGDSELNDQILYEIRERVSEAGGDVSLEWAVKDGARSNSIKGAPVDQCGWKTAADARRQQMTVIVEKFEQFRALLEPHVKAVYQELG